MMEQNDLTAAQRDVDALRAEDKIKRRPRKDSWADLRKHTAQILGWAEAKGGSKYLVQRLLSRRCPELRHVSADRIYRFVLSVNGKKWPNGRKKSEGGH